MSKENEISSILTGARISDPDEFAKDQERQTGIFSLVVKGVNASLAPFVYHWKKNPPERRVFKVGDHYSVETEFGPEDVIIDTQEFCDWCNR